MNPLEHLFRRLDALQQRTQPTAFVFAVMKKFGDDNGGVLVNNLAFSAFLAVFPLLLVLVTVLGLVMAGYPGVRSTIVHSALANFPVIGPQLGRNVHALRQGSTIGLVIGLALLVWGASGLAQSGLFTMAEVWNLPGPKRPNFVKRLGRSGLFLAVMAVGLVMSSGLAAFGASGRQAVIYRVLGELLALAVNVGQFILAFRVLTPKVVRFRQLVPGALAGGLAWTILQAIGGYLVGHNLQHAGELYGTFGMVLGLVAWIYLGTKVTVYTAEINTVLAYRLWPRGLVQPPLTAADQRSMALQASQNQRRPEQQVTVHYTEPPGSQEEYLEQESRSSSRVDTRQ